MRRVDVIAAMLSLCAGGLPVPCAGADPPAPIQADLDARYEALRAECGPYGPGGEAVLEVAYRVLREGRADGLWPDVGLEDLWAEAVKEGAVLFNRPERRWGLTRSDDSLTLAGQKTLGPWQMTVSNIKNAYGLPYGIEPEWSDTQVYRFCRARPELQARMIADYIQEAYSLYGRRGPYGIQRYFALSPFVRGEIGRGEWDDPVLPSGSGGPSSLSAAAKAGTGFYGKQLLLGTYACPRGLLYWLWVTGDFEGIRRTLRTWRDQRLMVWDAARNRPVLTEEDADFDIRPEDLKYLEQFPECHADLVELVREVQAEKEKKAPAPPPLVATTRPACPPVPLEALMRIP